MPTSYKLSESERQQILELHRNGMSAFQIALQMGIYPNSVYHHLKQAKLGKAPRKVRKAEK